MISRKAVGRCVCWENAEEKHRSRTASPKTDFCIAFPPVVMASSAIARLRSAPGGCRSRARKSGPAQNRPIKAGRDHHVHIGGSYSPRAVTPIAHNRRTSDHGFIRL